MKRYYDKMLKAFEKKHGNLDGWQAGKAFQQYLWIIAMVLGVNFLQFQDVIWHKYLFYAVIIALVNWHEA